MRVKTWMTPARAPDSPPPIARFAAFCRIGDRTIRPGTAQSSDGERPVEKIAAPIPITIAVAAIFSPARLGRGSPSGAAASRPMKPALVGAAAAGVATAVRDSICGDADNREGACVNAISARFNWSRAIIVHLVAPRTRSLRRAAEAGRRCIEIRRAHKFRNGTLQTQIHQLILWHFHNR